VIVPSHVYTATPRATAYTLPCRRLPAPVVVAFTVARALPACHTHYLPTRIRWRPTVRHHIACIAIHLPRCCLYRSGFMPRTPRAFLTHWRGITPHQRKTRALRAALRAGLLRVTPHPTAPGPTHAHPPPFGLARRHGRRTLTAGTHAARTFTAALSRQNHATCHLNGYRVYPGSLTLPPPLVYLREVTLAVATGCQLPHHYCPDWIQREKKKKKQLHYIIQFSGSV